MLLFLRVPFHFEISFYLYNLTNLPRQNKNVKMFPPTQIKKHKFYFVGKLMIFHFCSMLKSRTFDKTEIPLPWQLLPWPSES